MAIFGGIALLLGLSTVLHATELTECPYAKLRTRIQLHVLHEGQARKTFEDFGVGLPYHVRYPTDIHRVVPEADGIPSVEFGYLQANEKTPPEVTEILKELEAEGGKARMSAKYYFNSTYPGLVTTGAHFRVDDEGIPIIAVGNPAPTSTLVHEGQHFRDWKKKRDEYVRQGLSKLDAARLAWRDMATPRGLAEGERSAKIAELKSNAVSGNSVANGLRYADLISDLNYPEYTALHKIYSNTKKEKRALTPDEKKLAENMMDKLIWRTLLLYRDHLLVEYVKAKAVSPPDAQSIDYLSNRAKLVGPNYAFFELSIGVMDKTSRTEGTRDDLAQLFAGRLTSQMQRFRAHPSLKDDPAVRLINDSDPSKVREMLLAPLDPRTERYARLVNARSSPP